MMTATRDTRGRVRLQPLRPIKYNLSLTPEERDTLDRRTLELGYPNAAECIRQEFINRHPRSAS